MGAKPIKSDPNELWEKYHEKLLEEKSNTNKMRFREEWDLQEFLGSGSYSVVYRATCRVTKKYSRPIPNGVAVKVIFKENLSDLKEIKHEIEILGLVQHHPGITCLFEVWYLKKAIMLFENFITGKNLDDLLQSAFHLTPLPEKIVATIAAQVLSELAFLHHHKIAHCDIKLANIIYDPKLPVYLGTSLGNSKFNTVLADFGLSRIYSKPLTSAVGTPYFIAPECLDKKASFNEKVDIWSLGVVLYVCLVGEYPYDAKEVNGLLTKIHEAPVTFKSQKWSTFSSDCHPFLSRLLTKDPNNRPSALEAMKHDWILNFMDTTIHNPLLENPQHKPKLTVFFSDDHMNQE